MLNYVVALVLEYLIFDSHSYLRDTSGFEASVFPQGKMLPDEATWPSWTIHGARSCRSASCSRSESPSLVWLLYTRTRFGFEVQVIGDSPRAGRYAGMRTRRKILAVMCLSGAIAGIGGASQDGDFRHQLDPRRATPGELRVHGHRRRSACALQPVCRRAVALLIGGLQNAGLHAAGRRLPERPRRRDARTDPLLRARRRAVRPLPRPLRTWATSARRRLRSPRREQQPRRGRARVRRPLRHAAALRSARGSCSPSVPACSISASRG